MKEALVKELCQAIRKELCKNCLRLCFESSNSSLRDAHVTHDSGAWSSVVGMWATVLVEVKPPSANDVLYILCPLCGFYAR